MFRTRISVSTSAFQEEIRQALQRAHRLRVQGVQFDLRNEVTPRLYGDSARRQLLHYLKERNLVAASGTFPLRSALGAREHLDERLHALRTAIEFASQLKIRVLTVRTGVIPAGEDVEDRGIFRQVVSDLATQGNLFGVVLNLIPGGESANDLNGLIAEIKSGPVAIVADLAGWVLHGLSPASQLRTLSGVIGHVEVRDGIRGVDGLGREVPVGRGEVDWDEVAALLAEMEYSGWLNVNRTLGEDRINDIDRAVQYLRNLIPQG